MTDHAVAQAEIAMYGADSPESPDYDPAHEYEPTPYEERMIRVVNALWHAGPMSVKQLESYTGLDQSAVRQAIARAEAIGSVRADTAWWPHQWELA